VLSSLSLDIRSFLLLQETTGDKLTYVNDAQRSHFFSFQFRPHHTYSSATSENVTSSIDCYLELVRLANLLNVVVLSVVNYRIVFLRVNGMQQDPLQVAYVVVNQALSTDGDIRKKGNKKLSNEEKQTRK
jgi:hypothetical protein